MHERRTSFNEQSQVNGAKRRLEERVGNGMKWERDTKRKRKARRGRFCADTATAATAAKRLALSITV